MNNANNTLSSKQDRKTAAIIIIGDEILSGRTLDTNTQFIATNLTNAGIDLIETRTIGDDRIKIIDSVKEFSNKYNYVFTSGGIGPTHDDITSQAISDAFGLEYTKNQEAYEILDSLYKARGEAMNPARTKMAYMPKNVELIKYSPPGAPGFKIENVYVLAGVPSVLKSMIESVMLTIDRGDVIVSKNLDILAGESKIADDFEELQKRYPEISMGSYPFIRNGKHGTSLVLRSRNYALLNIVFQETKSVMSKYSA